MSCTLCHGGGVRPKCCSATAKSNWALWNNRSRVCQYSFNLRTDESSMGRYSGSPTELSQIATPTGAGGLTTGFPTIASVSKSIVIMLISICYSL